MVTLNTEQRLSEPTIAVLIDHENVGLDYNQYLFDQLADMGRVIVKRAYADWSAHRSKRDQLLEHGIQPMHYFHNTRSGKNSSDICLVIDAVDLLYNAHIDTFVIASSDSDFVPLVNKLRGAGKLVVGAGRRDFTSPTLVKSCDRYIYLDDAIQQEQRRKVRQSRSSSTSGSSSGSLVARALESSHDGRGQVPGSKLHQMMLRIDPGFNFKERGFSTFTRYLESLSEIQVSRSRDAGDIMVQLNASHDPDGRTPAAQPPPDQPQPAQLPAAEPPLARPPVSQAPVTQAPAAEPATNGQRTASWDRDVNVAWNERGRRKISAQAAAADVARAFSAENLKVTGYPTLDRVLAGSEYLRSRWRREGNAIIRR
ncbi:MAG: NYN domain-containing protein [SAR202 cluster bacterium]|jgi:uncharacterized protein (TIGR00288 family)|nr:NYN domain-containing protein [SAR202 cluster bacterium]MDP7226670.1 NYN domain-containing protein [SAR202 cluster bacterium]|tara:strand:+ start:4565 stop:5671 length:1107 start_codon:yes stop_codon:yes gene_type:complete